MCMSKNICTNSICQIRNDELFSYKLNGLYRAGSKTSGALNDMRPLQGCLNIIVHPGAVSLLEPP